MTTFYSTSETMRPGACTLPREYYMSEAVFQEEIERIFYARWLCVCREEEIPEVGDYILQEIGTENLIIVRDSAREIQAYYNVCRHRGTRLCTEAKGRFSKTIQCPYHAWTYGLDGRLLGAPHMQEVSDFDRADYPLHSVAVACWEGFVFINMAQTPEPFEQAYAPFIDKFTPWRLPELRAAREIVYEVNCNWKLLFQNYSECYHCPPLHPELAKWSEYTSGKNDLPEGPFLGGSMQFNDGVDSMTESGRRCAVPILGEGSEDMDKAYYYTLYPNLFFAPHPDYVMIHYVWPQDITHTRIICRWLFHPEAESKPEYNPDDAVAFWDKVNRQDWHICEQSQQGIASRAYQPGPYSDRESLLAAFDQEIRAALGHEHTSDDG